MDTILNYRSEDTDDFYMLLGCDELSSVEQILAEFKIRALECHPDKHPGNSKAVETFQKLQKAKEILTNEESQAHYEQWRRSQILMPFQQWEALSDSVKTVGFSLLYLDLYSSFKESIGKRKEKTKKPVESGYNSVSTKFCEGKFTAIKAMSPCQKSL
ncbi:dnaJ homolog subfamily C member 12-like [Choloepus didactylus]|uniref:dnaJ homolog subfamily C member 12-like n=1 Tax=Choloepus didactylus TaxID=27675 RepID=UPI00189FAE99|nr:dnaJ homolog subfamily C member 12-like [Choloepus didactylus]